MKYRAGECLCSGDDGASCAAEQTKPGSGVSRAIEPAQSRRPASLSAWRRLGPQARRAKRARRPSSVAPAGPEGQPSEAGQLVTVRRHTCGA